MHRIELPARFYDDHNSRMSDRDPEEPAFSDRVLQRKGRIVVVEACDAALDEIQGDAEHYASMRAGVELERKDAGLILSARATVKRIKAYRAQLAGAAS